MITMTMKKALSGMKVWRIVMLIFMLSFIAVAPPLAQAAIPRYINYQGKLTDADDNPVTGSVNLTVRIYDAVTGGTLLWKEVQKTTVTRGVFSILLGNTEVLDKLDFNDPYWYSVEVESDGEMTPRQRLTSVAYAINADKLDGYDASSFLSSAPSGALSLTGGANQNVELNPTGTGDVVVTIDSSDFKITDGTTTWLTVDGETGNVTIAKNLIVSGNISGVNSSFTTLTVTGTSDLQGSISNSGASNSGAVSIADSLTQTGSTNQVTFAGNIDATNGVDVTGARVLIGTGTPSHATAAGDLYVQDDLEVGGMIYGDGSNITNINSATNAGTLDNEHAADIVTTARVQTALSNQSLDLGTGALTATGLTSAKVNSAGGSASSVTLSGTLGAMNGSDTFRGLYLNYTNADHSGTSNNILGVDINTITGDAEVQEDAIRIGSGWDSQLALLESGLSPTYYTRISAGDQAGDLTLTLPADAGTSGQFLRTDGSGTLSWTSALASVSGQDHASLANLAYAASGHTGFEPTVTKGNLTASSPLSFDQTRQVIGGAAALSIPKAGASTDGYLSSTDWVTFNGKLESSDAILKSPSGENQTIQPATDNIPLTIKGNAVLQTANLFEVQDSAGVSHLAVDKDGNITVANNTTAANSDGTIYLGRDSSSSHYLMWDDDYSGLDSNGDPVTGWFYTDTGMSVKNLEIRGTSPATITFGKGDNKKQLQFDEDKQEFSFSGGKLKQAFQNLVRGGSFESWNTPGWYSGSYGGAYCTTNQAKFGTKSLYIQDSSGTQAVYKAYYIPNWDRLKGNSVTLSVWAKCSSGTATASIGIGTDSSNEQATAITNISLTTTWQNFTFTSTVLTGATTLKVYLYASAGTNDLPAVANVTENWSTGNAVYYDGVTMVEGKLSLEYGPSPILDLGDQVIGGSLAIGADMNPYESQGTNYYMYPRLVFGEPDVNFGGYNSAYGSGYNTYGGGTGEISFRRMTTNAATFNFNRPISVDVGYCSSAYGNNPGLFLGNRYYTPVDTPDYAWSPTDAYIKGVLEADGGIYGDIMSFYGGVGKTGNLLTHSEAFDDQTAWSKSNVTVATGQTAPNGAEIACGLTATASPATISQTVSPASASTAYTFSVYMAPDTQFYPTISLISNGSGDYEVSKYANLYDTTGWRRFSVTKTTPSNASTITAKITFSSGAIKVWGAQLRAASTPSIYLATTDNSVTNSTSLFHGDGSDLTNLPAASGTSAITGTSENTFTLNTDVTGNPSENMTIAFNRGNQQDATITWNESASPKRFDFNNLVNISSGGLTVAGTITAGTGPNVITTAAGLLDATKLSGNVPIANGGTNKSSWTQYCIPYASATTTLSEIPIGTAGQILTVSNPATGYTWTNNLSVSKLTNLTTNGFVKTSGSDGTLTVDNITLSGDVSGSGTTSITTTIGNGAVTLAKMANLAANSIIGNNTSSTATPIALTASQTKTLLSLNYVDNVQQMPFTYLSASTNLGPSDVLVPTQNAVKVYVDNAIAGLHWKEPVLAIQADPPTNPANGDRCIVTTETGVWSGKKDYIGQYNGSSWSLTAPQESFAVFNNADDSGYVYNGTNWVTFSGATAYDWGSGLSASGITVNVGATAPIAVGTTNVSLNYDTNDLGVDGSDKLYVKDAGIDHNALTNYAANQHIDWTNASSNLTTSGNISTTGSGTVTVAGGASISGGLNNNTGGITNAGAISGATTIVASSTITQLRSVGLAPEYDNAAPMADGSDNFGTLSLQYDSINKHNYYEWTTNEPTTQDYDIVLRYRLPDGFTSFDSVPIKLWNRVSGDTGTTAVTVSMRDTSGSAVTLSGGSNLKNISWTESEITISGTPTFQAGGYVTITIKLSADQGDTVDVGELTLKGNW